MTASLLATDQPLVRINFGAWVETIVDWMTSSWVAFFGVIKDVLTSLYDSLVWVLATPPFWYVILVLGLFALLAKGWFFAIGSVVGLVIIYSVDQWDNAMETLSLVFIATAIALIIAIPLGIWAAKSKVVWAIVRPILDFMQTMPAFVYLIPTVVIFLTGVVPGIVATVIFALAPGVRSTQLGLRRVDPEVVEAGKAFGASPWRILRQIEMPLALPNIMSGVNQVIMLSLSMVVIAGMVGAGGLGQDVVTALTRIDVALGFESGLAVVILAIYLDRMTSALGSRSKVSKAMAASEVDA